MLQEKRKEFRIRLGDELPPELDTDFNLNRWIVNYDEDVDRCEQKFREYLRDRKALGYDSPTALENFYERKDVKNFCEVFSLSTLDENWINENDNGIVFVETGVQEPGKVVKAIRAGDYAGIFFGYCEYFQKMVMEREERTGKPSHGVCIFDMKLMSMLYYANPLAPMNRLFQIRVNIWQEYYGELLKRVVIVNPPKLVGAVFKIMSFLLPARVLDRFTVATSYPADIEKYVSTNAIPVAYGGTKSVPGVELNGCHPQRQVTKDEYRVDGEIWQAHKVANVKYETHMISCEPFVQELDAQAGQRLLFEYHANREFEVALIKDGKDYLLPHYKLSTPVLAEEGAIPIAENCKLRFEVRNLSKFMKMKLKIAVRLV